MNKYLILIVIVLLALIGAGYKQVKYANDRYEVAMANMKAYDVQLSSQGNNVALQLTIDQLEAFRDSVLIELNNTRKELDIKDKDLKSLQKISSSFSKSDTIIMSDTIYKNPSFAMDTIIGDMWYSVKVGMKYPSTITVKPEFKSIKHVVVSTKKETVNPPKKFFLLRWFQKKHRVVRVNVVECNPYVNEEISKYVEIL